MGKKQITTFEEAVQAAIETPKPAPSPAPADSDDED